MTVIGTPDPRTATPLAPTPPMPTDAATPAPASPSGARLRAARGLMSTAAAGALLSAVGAVGVIASASPDTQMVETWRGVGYLVFAGLFTLLAWQPTAYRGLWELVLLHKVALTITAIGYSLAGSAHGTGAIIGWDGALSVIVATAYVAARGWSAGPRHARTTA